MSAAGNAAARVLLVGQDPDVLAFILQELADAGAPARGTPLAQVEAVADEPFDLVSFGGGVPWRERKGLEDRFRAAHPQVRFVRTYAPYAASQIAAALASPQSPDVVDLRAYCARVGYGGPLEPTMETLRALQARHLDTIPFEAIDVLLDRGVDIAPAAVDAKLIAARRGGYCYEQNSLFRRVLTTIGFEVDPLVASVRWGSAPGVPPPPRTHMALRVWIDGAPWLVDVGFGAAVPSAPLRIDTREVQSTGDGRYRITPLGAGFVVQIDAGRGWLPLYDFAAEPLLESQYELFNWFTATHPSSRFRQQLIVARTTPEARYALLDARLTVRPHAGETERRRLAVDEIEQVLETVFGLRPEMAWRPLLDAAVARTPDG
jgi:N-hydroxyarylamine O-acetyltransferase